MPQRDADGNGHDGSGVATETVLEAMKSKELLGAAALSAAGAVAAAKAPALVKKLTHATEDRGEDEAERLGVKAAEGAKSQAGGGLGGKLLGKALGGGGGSDGGGGKKTRRLPIQRWTDVAVPVDTAYEAWTNFDDFPRFMHRVLNVEQKGQDRLSWQEKIWFSKRQWEGRITERRKNERIVWKTTNGMSHKGIVSFHPLAENLTRVMIDMEFEPTGMIEKMASGLRFVKRAVQSDLARFKAYVEMEDAKGIEYRSTRDDGDDDEGGRGSARDPHESDAKRSERRKQREGRRRAATS
jgi:polyketide cyclase/dehydrase/lipid transport protein